MKLQKIMWCLLAGLVVFAPPAKAALFDHTAYDEILKRYVDDEGLVDYASIRRNSLTALDSYFERQADADLAGWPYTERLAFWIDVYNAHVISFIAHQPYPNKAPQDTDMLNRPFKVAGALLSLNDIEYRILRGAKNPDNKKGPIPGLTMEKRDPRIHFALVPGTIGAPKLRNFAYTAENVEDTLYGDAKRFANSSKYVDIEKGTLKLAMVLKRYAKDFDSAGGVAAYLSDQITPEKRQDADEIKQLLAKDFQKAEYFSDNQVNDQKKAALDLTQ